MAELRNIYTHKETHGGIRRKQHCKACVILDKCLLVWHFHLDRLSTICFCLVIKIFITILFVLFDSVPDQVEKNV